MGCLRRPLVSSHLLNRIVCYAALLLAAWGIPGLRAAEPMRNFAVPAGEAETALRIFARQAAAQLIFDPQIVDGLRTRAVRGRLTPDDALREMLAGTALQVVRDDLTGALAIKKESAAVTETKDRRVLHGTPKQVSGPSTPNTTAMSNPVSSPKSPRGLWSRLLSGLALLAAGQLDAQTDATKRPEEEIYKMDALVVTGVTYAQTQFESSFAVTSLSSYEIHKYGALNLANLLGQVPGIFTESTGGEVQNVIRERGIPNESSFQAFQVDGLPIHPDEGYFFKGEGLVRPDIMTRSFEIIRGGPAPIFASNAAAIYNNVTRQGSDASDSAVQLTVGDTNLYRLDGYWSGKIADKTYLAAGGFYRRNDGPRPNGFPSDHGGQLQINLRREIEGGEVKLSLFALNDHNMFYLPIPIADPNNPSVSLNPYLDYFTGTLNTPSLQNALFVFPNEAGQIQRANRDLSNGRHFDVVSSTLDFKRQLGAWQFSNKLRLTGIKLSFDAIYSTSNPATTTAFAAPFTAAATAAFAGFDHFGYAIGGTNGGTPYTSPSGLVIQAQYRGVNADLSSVQDEARLSRDFELLGTHHGIVGLYATEYTTTEETRYQDYLFELASNPRPLDLLAYNAAGAVIGSVTDRGVLRYSNTLNGGHSDMKEVAVFAADTWNITPHLKLDYGLRRERYDGDGLNRLTKSSPIAPTAFGGVLPTLAGSNALAFTGSNVITHYSESVTPWTIGANYDFNRHFGVYARASKSYRVATDSVLFLNQVPITTTAEQYEVGVKINRRAFSAFLTAFYTKFDPYVQTFQAVNPVTGSTGNLNFVGQATTPGVEADITWKPFQHFSIDSSLTYNRPRGGNYFSSLGADASAAEDKQLIRTPDWFGNIRPTVSFEVGKWSMRADLRYNFVGQRYVDIKNTTVLPAYRTFGAGLTAEQGPWSFHLLVDNLTNAHGLTEGNPRSDVISGQGTKEAVYGRPLFGRSFRLETTYHF